MRKALIAAMVLFVGFAGFGFSAASGQASPVQQSPQGPRTYYVAFLDLGPKYDRTLTPFQQTGIREHAAYMSQLTKEGKLLVGGPFVEKAGSLTATGAIMFIAADSLEQARAILEADPGHKSGLLSLVEVRPLVVTGGAWLK